MPRTTLVSALASGLAVALVSGNPSSAATFVFQKSFDVAGFGSSSGGTLRGLAWTGDSLLVNDALDDQIFFVDPVAETATSTAETDPFTCELGNLDCIPTQEWSRVARDVAFDGQDIWLVDKEPVDGSTTWLIQLNAAGEYLDRFDADASGAQPGGLTYDPRGAGALLVTDFGSDDVSFFDLAGNAIGVSSLEPGGVGSEAPTGIAHLGGDVFLVSDSIADTVYEFVLPSGGGAATLIGESIFQGIDISTLTQLESVDYDPVTQTLYLLDDTSNKVYVFGVVPEPGTGVLLALGLGVVAATRRRV